MKQIGKPLVIGEVGMKALNNGTNCMTFEERKNKMKAKMDAMFSAGVAGFIPWNRATNADTVCNYDIGNSDPAIDLLNKYRIAY